MAETADIAALYRRHITMVRGRAQRLLGNPAAAEDVAQEAFVKLLEHRARGETEESTGGFLYRITTNLALNLLRDTKRRRELLDAQPTTGSTSDPTDDRVTLRKVMALVGKQEAQGSFCSYDCGSEPAGTTCGIGGACVNEGVGKNFCYPKCDTAADCTQINADAFVACGEHDSGGVNVCLPR